MTTDGTLPTLGSGRVRLRGIVAGDADDLFAIFSDRDLMRYWSRLPMADRSEALELVGRIDARRRDGTLFQWGIALADDSRLIGTCTLAAIDRANGRAEIGFIVRADRHGRGYASEAVATVLDHAFDDLGLRRIEADVDPRNDASIRLLERLGFVREGFLRERWCVGGEIADTVLYGLLCREWRRAVDRQRSDPGSDG